MIKNGSSYWRKYLWLFRQVRSLLLLLISWDSAWLSWKFVIKSGRYLLKLSKIIIISKCHWFHTKISTPTGATTSFQKVKEISSILHYVRLSFQNFAFMSSSLLFQSTLFARVTNSFSFGTYSTEKNGTYSISLIKHVLLHCHVSSTYHFL